MNNENYYVENMVFDRDDLYINMDKFESGKCNVILVTGFSGSGKTTLGSNMLSKYKCDDHFELDALEWWFNGNITIDQLQDGMPPIYEWLIHNKASMNMKNPSNQQIALMMDTLIPYVINWCRKHKDKKYVVEGIQLYENWSSSEKCNYLDYPMILKGTSGLKSTYRAMKRNGDKLSDIPFYLKWLCKSNKQVDALYKAMKEAFDNEPIIEDYDPMSFFKKYSDDLFEESSFMSEYLQSSHGRKKVRKNEDGETVPETCPKCGGKIGVFIQGEPVYLCKECKKYFGVVKFPSKKKNKPVTESVDPECDRLVAFMEAAAKNTSILKELIYPVIEKTFSTQVNIRKYTMLISNFFEKNTAKLTTPGPQFLIVFGDNDKEEFYKLFGMKKEDITDAMRIIIKSTGSSAEFKYLMNNPFLSFLYYVIRYFTMNPNPKALNATLGLFAIDVYWSIFTKYFPNGVIEPVMNYTIDNLTDKFIIKKAGTIFGALTESAKHSYEFHKSKIKVGNDPDCISFLQRIRNDQNSMFRTLSGIYYDNHKKGNAIATRNDDYDPDNPILDDITSASTEIENTVNRVCMPMISNGVDIALAEAAAMTANVSITNLRIYLMKIFVNERLDEITKLVESMIFLYINGEHKSVRDIRSSHFLYWTSALFKKTNSKDGNIVRINAILDKWGNETGIYKAFKSEGSKINYKRAIFTYIAMSIQKYN